MECLHACAGVCICAVCSGLPPAVWACISGLLHTPSLPLRQLRVQIPPPPQEPDNEQHLHPLVLCCHGTVSPTIFVFFFPRRALCSTSLQSFCLHLSTSADMKQTHHLLLLRGSHPMAAQRLNQPAIPVQPTISSCSRP